MCIFSRELAIKHLPAHHCFRVNINSYTYHPIYSYLTMHSGLVKKHPTLQNNIKIKLNDKERKD